MERERITPVRVLRSERFRTRDVPTKAAKWQAWVAMLELHGKVRRMMVRKQLYRARVECPNCAHHRYADGRPMHYIHARRDNGNNHVWAKCDGPCGFMVVE